MGHFFGHVGFLHPTKKKVDADFAEEVALRIAEEKEKQERKKAMKLLQRIKDMGPEGEKILAEENEMKCWGLNVGLKKNTMGDAEKAPEKLPNDLDHCIFVLFCLRRRPL